MFRHVTAVAGFMALAALASGSTAWAAWGCAARGDRGGWGNSHSSATQSAAEDSAMRVCGEGCYIIGCSPNVDTSDQARALWRVPSPPKKHCEGSVCVDIHD
jgi:hypothetical protein